ncbi:hypothetical protein JCM16303_005520 [Sporobolomyces ruberrimus]
MGSMTKIGEGEFPNVGALREARREKLKKGEEEGTGKLMAGKKGRRSSNGLSRESRTPAKAQSAVSPYQDSRRRTSPALPTPKTPRSAGVERKVKLKPRVSFPHSPPPMTRAASATTQQGMMNRPRAVPRRKGRKRSIARFEEVEEEGEEDAGKEWLDEAQTFDHFVHPLRPSSRLSITSIVKHLPFLRSYTPVQPPPLKLSPTSSTSSSRSNTTLSPNRSHPKDDPSDESFHCRGEDTPTSTREPPLPRTLDTPTREGSPWSEIHFRGSEWRDRSVGETSSDSPESSVSRRSRRNPKWRVHGNDQSPSSIASPPPGDLTRFLEDLLIEERIRPAEILAEEVPDDVFADAPEANENDATRQGEKESGEYEYEISVVRTESLTRSFKLGQPRGGSTRIIEYRSPLASPTSLHFHEGSRTDFLAMSTNAQAEGGELVEPIKVVSASRETFIRGPLVRKGSLSSLGLLSPIPTSTDPIEEPEDKREESILATLQDQARHRNPRSLPTRPTLSPSRSTSFLRSKTFTATSFESRQTPRSATPLPFLNTFGTPSSSFSFEKEQFVTAPSTPYESLPLPVPSTSTSSILSTRSKSREEEEEEEEEREEAQPRTPLSPLFDQDQDASFKTLRRRRQEVIERIRSESKKRKRRETIMFSSATTVTRGIEFHHDHFFDETNGVGRQGRDGEEEEGEKEG